MIERNYNEGGEPLVRMIFDLCLFIFLGGVAIIVMYENFKNGIPPEPQWWLDFEQAIGVTW
jgi:hypothetical protein